MNIKIIDSKKMKNYFFELLNNNINENEDIASYMENNSEIVYQDNKDVLLIKILKFRDLIYKYLYKFEKVN